MFVVECCGPPSHTSDLTICLEDSQNLQSCTHSERIQSKMSKGKSAQGKMQEIRCQNQRSFSQWSCIGCLTPPAMSCDNTCGMSTGKLTGDSYPAFLLGDYMWFVASSVPKLETPRRPGTCVKPRCLHR